MPSEETLTKKTLSLWNSEKVAPAAVRETAKRNGRVMERETSHRLQTEFEVYVMFQRSVVNGAWIKLPRKKKQKPQKTPVLRNTSCVAYQNDKESWTRNLGLSWFKPILASLVIRMNSVHLWWRNVLRRAWEGFVDIFFENFYNFEPNKSLSFKYESKLKLIPAYRGLRTEDCGMRNAKCVMHRGLRTAEYTADCGPRTADQR